MAAFNHDRYIRYAIESVLSQTLQDFELIVVDDGSTDQTPAEVSRFGTKVRYIRQENRGQGAARNVGIAQARGEYVCFLDDDDIWEANYLETVNSFFHHQPRTDALYTGYHIIDSKGAVLPQVSRRVIPPAGMYDTLVEGGWFPPLVVTVRKACLDLVGPLDESVRGHDDWDLWLRIAKDYVFRGIRDLRAMYRVHVGGLSANVAHMLQDQKRVIAKHFGLEEGAPDSWPDPRRRAYGAAYRSAAFSYLQCGDGVHSQELLHRAFQIDPHLLLELETYYEWAVGDVPRGYRSDVSRINLLRTSSEMVQGLEFVFAHAPSDLRALRKPAFGNAYLALAMLYDQAGNWNASRRYLWQALQMKPDLSHHAAVKRRLLKLILGKHVNDVARRLKPQAPSERLQD